MRGKPITAKSYSSRSKTMHISSTLETVNVLLMFPLYPFAYIEAARSSTNSSTTLVPPKTMIQHCGAFKFGHRLTWQE